MAGRFWREKWEISANHGMHRCESHARLVSYLNKLGEGTIAAWWQSLENLRQGGWYGGKTQAPAVQEAFDFLAKIGTWATH